MENDTETYAVALKNSMLKHAVSPQFASEADARAWAQANLAPSTEYRIHHQDAGGVDNEGIVASRRCHDPV